MDLSQLHSGFPGITPVWGESLSEAARICLEAQALAGPCHYPVDGDITASHTLTWPSTTDQMRRAWNDLDEAAEHGAYGMAALIIAEHTSYEVVERSRKGTGFDYWLGLKGEDTEMFQHTARLEVSGINRGDDSAVKARVKKKLIQTSVTDGVLPAYVIVVEFSTPRARVILK